LEAVYKTFKDENLVCVLGSCGGGRDKWKRPELGKIAAKYCREIIVTNEDPYDENPMDIINQVAETAGPTTKKILDRKEAIKTSVKIAKPGDVIVITGKGSEPWMCVENGHKIPWDDRQIAREAIKDR
jgi:UDP-N-acetylmuramoyl-L-alanyl-D-glutamate--2,6-diaminopimelate ligase